MDVVTDAVDAFDLALVEQLAVLAACDALLSPHSGFGFAASCVGTPWATISGGRWPEYFFNGAPFRPVLPDPRRYPCYTHEKRRSRLWRSRPGREAADPEYEHRTGRG
jgi:hypothetical protein